MQLCVLLQIAGLAVTIVLKDEAARYGAAIAAGASLSVGFLTLIAGLRPPDRLWPLALSILVIASSTALLIYIARNLIANRSGRLLLALPVILLPLIQFWYSSTWVPAQLHSSVGLEITPLVQAKTKDLRRGVIQVKIANSGDVGAVLLFTEEVVCIRASDTAVDWNLQHLYADRSCTTSRLLTEGTVLDPKATWTINETFTAKKSQLLLQTYVAVWYARSDKLLFPEKVMNTSISQTKSCTRRNPESRRVLSDSPFRSLVEKPRYLTYEGGDVGGVRAYWLTDNADNLCSGGDAAILNDQLGINSNFHYQRDWVPTS
jgi:hypothetical protein